MIMERKYKDRFTNRNAYGAGHILNLKSVKETGDKALVKWMGYPKSFNSLIDTKAMAKL